MASECYCYYSLRSAHGNSQRVYHIPYSAVAGLGDVRSRSRGAYSVMITYGSAPPEVSQVGTLGDLMAALASL